MIKLIAMVVGVFVGICAFWIASFYVAQATGFNLQSTPEYGFSSGLGPMLLTALLGSGVFVTMWHSLNCHEQGCWNFGKHKVNGTPWCNLHHESARHTLTTEQLLEQILEELRKR